MHHVRQRDLSWHTPGVFAVSEARFARPAGPARGHSRAPYGCGEVFSRGADAMEVRGRLLEDEEARVQEDDWQAP